MTNSYDLKLEMLKSEPVKECLKDILDKIHAPLSFEEIFETEHHLEKYLLFKIQGCLGVGFDCDKSAPVKDFFKQKYGYTGSGFDTIVSMQYLWGFVLRNLWKKDSEQLYFPTNSKEYFSLKEKYGSFTNQQGQEIYRIDNAQKFIYELAHLSEIKEILGQNLVEHFCELSVYYHTLGNMSPCPEGAYNKEKGSYIHHCFDRLDLFIQTDFFQQNTEWVDWFSQNAETYLLQDFMAPNLPPFPKLQSGHTEEYIQEVCQYIDTFLSLITNRGYNLMKGFLTK